MRLGRTQGDDQGQERCRTDHEQGRGTTFLAAGERDPIELQGGCGQRQGSQHKEIARVVRHHQDRNEDDGDDHGSRDAKAEVKIAQQEGAETRRPARGLAGRHAAQTELAQMQGPALDGQGQTPGAQRRRLEQPGDQDRAEAAQGRGPGARPGERAEAKQCPAGVAGQQASAHRRARLR